MTWELHPAQQSFPAFVPEWDRLNRDLYANHPMFDSRFIGPLLEYFGTGNEVLCIHRSGSQINGALILCPRGYGRWSLFLPSQAQIGTLLLNDASILSTLFRALPGWAWSIDLLALDPDYSPEWANLRLPRKVTTHALTMAIANDGSFDDYWQSRSVQLRQNLRRYRRRCDANSAQRELIAFDSQQTIEEGVARYGEIESAGWKGKAGTAVNINNQQGKFYQSVLKRFAETGQAQVLELHLGGKLAATRLIIRNQGMMIMLKTAYDESLGQLAPGRQLLHEALQRAFANPSHPTIEFYTNASRDQAEWATSLRHINHHQLFRNAVVANLVHALKATRQRISRSKCSADTAPVIKDEAASARSFLSPDELPKEAASLFKDQELLGFEHSRSWYRHLHATVYAGDTGIRYYVGFLGQAARVILPVRLTREGWIREIQSLGNYYTSLYAPAVSPDGTAPDLAAVLSQASRDHGKPHLMRFAPLDSNAPTYETLLTALRSIGWIPFSYFAFGNWFQQIDCDWKSYLEQRDGKLKNVIKRKGKKFQAAGGSLEIIAADAQIDTAIEAYETVYAKSWKQPEPYPEFMPGLIRWLAEKGWLRLGIARIDGKPVAAQIWIVAQDKASIYKLAYDEEYAGYAPGTLLSAYLMQHVIDQDRVREVDYLIGDDPYKADWLNRRRERWGIIAYNPKTFIGIGLICLELIGRARKRILGKTSANTRQNG